MNVPARLRSDRKCRSRRLGVVLGLVVLLLFLGLTVFALWYDAPPVEARDLEVETGVALAPEENGLSALEGQSTAGSWGISDLVPLLMSASSDIYPGWGEWDQVSADRFLMGHSHLLKAADEALAKREFRFPPNEFPDRVACLYPIRDAFWAMYVEAWSKFYAGDHVGGMLRSRDLAVLACRVLEGDGASWHFMVGEDGATMGAHAMARMAARTPDRGALRVVIDDYHEWVLDQHRAATLMKRSTALRFQAFREFAERGGREAMALYGYTSDEPAPWWAPVLTKPNVTVAMWADVVRELSANADRLPRDWDFSAAESLTSPPSNWWEKLDVNYSGKRFPRKAALGVALRLRDCVRLRAVQGMAVLLAGLRLYEIDHGELPPTLTALQPGYLDELPPDPYSGEYFLYDPPARRLSAEGHHNVDGHQRDDWDFRLTGMELWVEAVVSIPGPTATGAGD